MLQMDHVVKVDEKKRERNSRLKRKTMLDIGDSVFLAKKRDLPNYQAQQRFTQPPTGLQNTRDSWNPKVWDWDSVGFVAKPVDAEELLRLGTPAGFGQMEQKRKEESMALTVDDERDLR
nr:hypothetical protein CFP56_39322 [Quercus suber]